MRKRTRPARIGVHVMLDVEIVHRLDRLAEADSRTKVSIIEEALALYLNAWEMKRALHEDHG